MRRQKPEQHFKIVEAARLTAANDSKTFKRWLIEAGYVLPDLHGRAITVPQSAIDAVNARHSVRPAR